MFTEHIKAARLHDFFSYDKKTGALFWRKRSVTLFRSESAAKTWNTRYAGKRAGYRSRGYVFINLSPYLLCAHRVVWAMHHSQWPSDEVDHINGDGEDNRIVNLRVADPGTQRQNMPMRRDNTSGHVGVYRSGARWVAQIKPRGQKTQHLGSFSIFEDAVRARTAAERTYGFHHNHGRERRK